MADDVDITAGSGTSIATDDIGGRHFQRVKVTFGADGTANDVESTTTNPLPVTTGTPGTAATDLAKAADSAAGGTDTGIAILAVRDDALTTLTPVDGDYVPMRTNSTGALWVDTGTVTVTGTVTIQDGGGSITVDSADLSTIAGAVSGTEMQVDVLTMPTTTVTGTVTANAGTGTMSVDLGGNNDVTIDGSAVIQTEDTAHGSGDTGIMPLAVRNDDLAALAGTDGDYAPLQVSQNGALLICPSANDDYKYDDIDAATSGDNQLVPNVASRKIRVLSVFMIAAGDVNVRFEDGAGGSALTGQMNLTTNSGFVLPHNPAGWFETSVNTALSLELSAAVSVDGALTYIEVP